MLLAVFFGDGWDDLRPRLDSGDETRLWEFKQRCRRDLRGDAVAIDVDDDRFLHSSAAPEGLHVAFTFDETVIIAEKTWFTVPPRHAHYLCDDGMIISKKSASWVFVPSYAGGRNINDVMSYDADEGCKVVQVLVVRKSEFAAYHEIFGSGHVNLGAALLPSVR
jgi:hypothetical protein